MATTALVLVAPGPTAPDAAAAETYEVPASGVWPVEGRGYGHGKGLGQWSAQAAALQGWTAEQIVFWAYPGTTGTQVGSPTVRVRLSVTGASVDVRMPDTGTALWIRNRSTGFSIPTPRASYRLTATPQGLTITDADSGAPLAVGGSSLASSVEVVSGDGVQIRNQDGSWTWYRGMLHIENTGSAVTVTNHLGLRDYLYGVVPRESPSWFHPQALRAQAFMAASYTLAVAKPTGAYDICDTVSCQVYGGRAKVSAAGAVTPLETASASTAVDAIGGWILSYDGRPAFTQFSASTGGWTRAGDRPYLVAQADPFSGRAPKDNSHAWTESLSVATVERSCPTGGRLVRLSVVGRDGQGEWGGRITSIRLDCTTGSKVLTGDSALRFGMKSSWWRIVGQQRAQRPLGHVDAAEGASGAIHVTGWAADPDEPERAIDVRVYVDGALTRTLPAAEERPDVAAAVSGLGAAHGFDVSVNASPGTRWACIWAVDTGGGDSTLLACPAIGVAAPPSIVGYLDVVQMAGPGQVRVSGWAADRDAPRSAIRVRITVDATTTEASAGRDRPDVATVFSELGGVHGYDETLALSTGAHRVCVTALGVATERALGCTDVVA